MSRGEGFMGLGVYVCSTLRIYTPFPLCKGVPRRFPPPPSEGLFLPLSRSDADQGDFCLKHDLSLK